MPCRRSNGLPRRFAPRNDSGGTYLHPRTRLSFCMSLRTSAHTCGNPFSPQKNSASWLLFGQIRSRLRIRPKYCFPSCCTARVTDCHVASLLAMTVGEACHCEQRSCTRAHVLPSACHCEPVRTLVWQSASRGDTLQIGCCFGEFVTPYGFAQSITFRFVQPQGMGLSRRFAPCNDMQKFAAWLHGCKDAMTCRSMHLCAWQGGFR